MNKSAEIIGGCSVNDKPRQIMLILEGIMRVALPICLLVNSSYNSLYNSRNSNKLISYFDLI